MVQRRAEIEHLRFFTGHAYPTKKRSFLKMPVFVRWEKKLTFQDRKENTKTDLVQGRIHMSTLKLLSCKAVG